MTFIPEALAYRPLTTEDAGVAGKGTTQFEISWDYLRWGPHEREHALLLVPIYGLTEHLELSVEAPYMFHEPESHTDRQGFGDVSVVGKYLVFKQHDRWPALAFKGIVKTSTGNEDKGLGSGDQDWSLVGVASKTLGDFAWHAMYGYTLIGDNDDENIRNIVLYGVATDYALTDAWHVVGEVSGNRHPDRQSDKDPLSGLLGVAYAVSKHLTLDGAVRIGLNDSMPDWALSIGTTVTF